MVDIYMEEYQDFILDQLEAIAEDITAEDVAKIAKMQDEAAGGMDQWMPAEF